MKKVLCAIIAITIWIPRLVLNAIALIRYSLVACYRWVDQALFTKKKKWKSI